MRIEENIPSDELKRIRVRFIRGLDCNADFINDVSYDVVSDITNLSSVANNQHLKCIGFTIEESYYEEGMYDNTKLGENEFHPLKSYYIGQEASDQIEIGGHIFCKPSYVEVVDNTIELRKKLATLILDIKCADSLVSIAGIYKPEILSEKKYCIQ